MTKRKNVAAAGMGKRKMKRGHENHKPSERGGDTKLKILKKGLKMWEKDPASVNAHAISKQLGIVHGTVLYHFPYGVRDAVAEYAIQVENTRVIAQLIVENHRLIKDLAPCERSAYLAGV